MGKGRAAVLAVLVTALLPPVLAEDRADAGAPAEKLERVCGWIDGPEALDPRVLEPDEDAPWAQCRVVSRCLSEARRAPGASAGSGPGASAPAGAEAVCGAVLALSPEDIRGLLDLLLEARTPPEAGDLGAQSCVGFLRCLLEPPEAGAEEGPEPPGAPSPEPPAASQAGSWRDEFARICSRTEDAAWLPQQEIEELIRKSEALLERIEELGIPEAKIYGFRLGKCKAFFEYALELEESRRD